MTATRCPTCKQQVDRAPTRVCYDCGQPIDRHDKWTMVEREVAPDVRVKVMGHRCCEEPAAYMTVDQYLANDHHPYNHLTDQQIDEIRTRQSERLSLIERWRTLNGRELPA